MKYYLQICLVIILFSSPTQQFAQQVQLDDKKIYGLDAQLINGEVYNNISNGNVRGHQFFQSEEFVKGTLTINDKVYICDQLNYDIHNQEVILKYATPYGSTKIITVSNAWLQKFSLGYDTFLIVKSNAQTNYYQIFNSDPIQLMYLWIKTIDLKNKSNDPYYSYSHARRSSFIRMNGAVFPFTNNKRFISIFDERYHLEIKKYMRLHKINVRKAPNYKMLELMTYCNSIINP